MMLAHASRFVRRLAMHRPVAVGVAALRPFAVAPTATRDCSQAPVSTSTAWKTAAVPLHQHQQHQQQHCRLLSTSPTPSTPNQVDQRAVGTWRGNLEAAAGGVAFVWRVPASLDGVANPTGQAALALFDFPDAFQYDTPSFPSVQGSELIFEIAGVGDFRGQLNAAGSEAVGRWSQGGAEYPITLVKESDTALVGEQAAAGRHVRPQQPSSSPPYHVHDFVVPSSGVVVAGTLTVPSEEQLRDGEAMPLALLLAGSGPHSRNQNVAGHDSHWVLADALTQAGVAVARIDKRGVGSSTGTFKGSTPIDFATDAGAVMRWLLSSGGGGSIMKGRTVTSAGILGHSEGALVGTMVANALGPQTVHHVGLLAGMAQLGKDLVLRQGYLVAQAEGLPAQLLDIMHPFNARMFDAAASLEGAAEVKAAVAQIRTEARAAVPQEAHEALGLTFGGSDDAAAAAADEAAAGAILEADVQWLLRHDPRPDMEALQCAVMALGGGRDLQVPPDNLEMTMEVLKARPNVVPGAPMYVQQFPAANHLFQPSTTGAVSEYNKIETTWMPEVLEVIGNWCHTVDDWRRGEQ